MSLLNKYGFTEREMEYMVPKPIQKMKCKSRLNRDFRVAMLIIFGVCMLALFIRWTEQHTTKAEAAYEKYEQCVKDTYGVSATKFYQVYGEPANCE